MKTLTSHRAGIRVGGGVHVSSAYQLQIVLRAIEFVLTQRRPFRGASRILRQPVFAPTRSPSSKARRSLLFCVKLPTARRLAPRAVPTITSATNTSTAR